MEGDHLPRIPAETRLKGSDDMHFCLRPYRSCLGPSRTPIRDGQGPVEVPHCLSTRSTARAPGTSRGSTPRLGPKGSGGGSMQVWMGILPPRGVLRV